MDSQVARTPSEAGNVVELRTPAPIDADTPEAAPWGLLATRHIPAEDWERFPDAYIKEIFDAFGMDLDTPGTRETPERYLRALFDATAGYEGDPKLLTAFPAEGRRGTAAAPARSSRGRSRSRASASTMRCRSTASRTSATSPASRSSASRS